MGITHATTAVGTDAGTGEIHKAQWNADHVITGAFSGISSFVLLEQHVAASSTSLDFTTFITSDYDEFVFEIVDLLPSTDGADLYMRMGTGGGPTFDSGTNYSNDSFIFRNGSTGTYGGTAQTAIQLDDTGGGIDTSTPNDAFNGTLHLFNPGGSHWKRVQGQTSCRNNFGPSRISFMIRGAYESTTAVTGIQFIASSGNISSGTIRVYGMAKSGTGAGAVLAATATTDTSVSQNTWTDVTGVSLSLAAGTYVVSAMAQCVPVNATSAALIRLYDGTNIYAASEQDVTSGGFYNDVNIISAPITLSSTTTIKLQAWFSGASGGSVKASTSVGTTGNNATRIVAISPSSGGNISTNASMVVDYGAVQLLLRRKAVNAEDDMFDAATLDAKWLAYTGANPTTDLTVMPGWCKCTSSGFKLQAVPAGDWTIETEVILQESTGTPNYQTEGLIMTNGTTATSGTDARFGIGHNNSVLGFRVEWEKFVNNSYNATYQDMSLAGTGGGAGFGNGVPWPTDHLFIRIRKVSTTYSVDISTTGKAFYQFGTTSSLGFTPTHFGFGGNAGGDFFNYFVRY